MFVGVTCHPILFLDVSPTPTYPPPPPPGNPGTTPVSPFLVVLDSRVALLVLTCVLLENAAPFFSHSLHSRPSSVTFFCFFFHPPHAGTSNPVGTTLVLGPSFPALLPHNSIPPPTPPRESGPPRFFGSFLMHFMGLFVANFFCQRRPPPQIKPCHQKFFFFTP